MSSLLQKSLALLRAPMNELAFAVRSRVRWQKGAPAVVAEPELETFDWLAGEPQARAAARELAARLEQRYDLAALRAVAPRLVRAENLAILERLLALGDGVELEDGKHRAGPKRADELCALDVGCGVFQYAAGLRQWLGTLAGDRAVRLRGIEIDGYGIYRDGHSRADHGQSWAAAAGPGVSYEVADFTRLDVPPQDVVSLFFPFLNAFSLLTWGSPLHHLKPRRCLERAVDAVRPGGLLVVVNQTPAEGARLRSLLVGLPVIQVAENSFATDLVPYRERTAGRIGSLWRRH